MDYWGKIIKQNTDKYELQCFNDKGDCTWKEGKHTPSGIPGQFYVTLATQPTPRSVDFQSYELGCIQF